MSLPVSDGSEILNVCGHGCSCRSDHSRARENGSGKAARMVADRELVQNTGDRLETDREVRRFWLLLCDALKIGWRR
nr:hypothetical protein Itr_chr01CG04350 [Ipomoea trifida]